MLSGTAILHSTREPDPPLITGLYLAFQAAWLFKVHICLLNTYILEA